MLRGDQIRSLLHLRTTIVKLSCHISACSPGNKGAFIYLYVHMYACVYVCMYVVRSSMCMCVYMHTHVHACVVCNTQ